MAETEKLKVETREGKGTAEVRRLRRQGLLPAVLYGHKQETLSLSLPREDFEKAIRHGARIVELSGAGHSEQALIQEVQWDHLGKDVLHVDFRRVSKDERVVVSVPLQLRGAVTVGGGVLDQPLHSLEIECLATGVPDHIRVSVADMKVGDVIHVRDLTLPPDVKAVTDGDLVVVHVTALHPEVEAAAAAAAPEQAEPEVIGRQKTEEGEEEK